MNNLYKQKNRKGKPIRRKIDIAKNNGYDLALGGVTKFTTKAYHCVFFALFLYIKFTVYEFEIKLKKLQAFYSILLFN